MHVGGVLLGVVVLLVCAMLVLGYTGAFRVARSRYRLRRSARELQQVYAEAALGFALLDKDLRYIWINQFLARHNGRSVEEHIGKTIYEVVPEFAVQAESPFRQVIRTGQPLRGVEFFGATRADPSVMRTWREEVYPIVGRRGEVIGVNVLVEDVTEEKRLTAALQASEARERQRVAELEAIMNAVPGGIYIAHDVECTKFTWNPEGARLLRLPAKSGGPYMLKRTWLSEYGSDRPLPESQAPTRRAVATGSEVRGAELTYHFEDGTRLHALAEAVPLRDANGNVHGAVGTLTDITRLKQVEHALLHEARRKDEFLAMLAHELRNPLMSIRSGLDLLKSQQSQSPEANRVLQIMDRQLSYLVHIIDDLLDVSRINSGKLELQKQVISLQSVINFAIENTRHEIENSGNTLVVEFPSTELRVEADPVRLTQVVGNLLQNAAKYSLAGGRIVVRLLREDESGVLQVQDSGIGIEQEVIPTLFKLFSQSEQSRGRRQGGLGIGLALVKWIADLHGGTVRAESAGRGCGSTFTVTLPLAAADEAAPGVTLNETSGGQDQKRVLIVDDNVDGTEVMASLLRSLGHNVFVAHSGRAGIDATRQWKPDVAFIDIGLPDITGYEVARELRKNGSSTSLIALSGWGGETDRQQSLQSGFRAHLTKPVPVDSIRAALGQ